MKNILDSMDYIDNDFISEADNYKPVKHFFTRKVLIACFCLIVVSFGITLFAVAANEYDTAVTFFEQNGLSSFGLSKAEIKAIYRDIKTEHFTYEKTADVILKNVEGYEITREKPTSDDLKDIWQNLQAIPKQGVTFKHRYEYVYDKGLGFDVFDKSYLDYYEDGEFKWSAEFTEFEVEYSSRTESGIVAWGHRYSHEQQTGEFKSYAYFACLDENGTVLWTRMLGCLKAKYENIQNILPDPDGMWSVFVSTDSPGLLIYKYDKKGNKLGEKNTGIESYTKNIVRIGDGYLVQTGTASVIKLDKDGNMTDTFVYEEQGVDYYITDMAEFSGKIYISAYAVPSQTDAGGRNEIGNILNIVFENMNGFYNDDDPFENNETLTGLLRDNYTAVLFVCDTDKGTPRTFYSVKASLTDALYVNGDKMEWTVNEIASSFFSPATNSFTIGGTCKVYRYVFDSDGNLAELTDTGEASAYRR